jgi:hypothetical protein
VDSALTFLNLNVTSSVTRVKDTPPEPDSFSVEAGRIDGLVLKINYKWPAIKKDMDSGTTFLGTRVGFKCGTSPYLNFTGVDTGLRGEKLFMFSWEHPSVV